MILQRRLSSKSTKFNHSKINRYDEQCENKPITEQFQVNILSLPLRKRSSRPQLGEITNNLNENVNNSLLFCNNTRTASAYTKRSAARSFLRNSQNNIKKQIEGLQDQKIQLHGFPEEIKALKILLERPRTSLGQHPVNQDFSTRKGQIFLEQFKEITNNAGQRMSTSRALSKYSTVQKNSQVTRFKVKRDRNLAPVYLASRKIVLHTKEKKQNNYAQKLKENLLDLRKKRRNQPFSEMQDYEIKGWEFD